MLNKREYLEIKMAEGIVSDAPTEATLPGSKFQTLDNGYNELGAIKMREGCKYMGASVNEITGVPFGLQFQNLKGTGYFLYAYNNDTVGTLHIITEGGTTPTALISDWAKTGTELDTTLYTFTKDNLPDTEATNCIVITNGVDALQYWDGTNVIEFGIDSGDIFTSVSGVLQRSSNLFTTATPFATASTAHLVKARNADIIVGGPNGSGKILFIKNNGKSVEATGTTDGWGNVAVDGDGLSVITCPSSGSLKPKFTVDGGSTYTDALNNAWPAGGGSCFPYISDDGAIMVTSSYNSEYSIQKTVDSGSNWSEVTGANIKSATLKPVAIKGSIDGNNIFVLRYNQVAADDADLILSKSTDRTANWSAIVKDLGVAKNIQSPRLAVSPDGTLVVVCYGNLTDGTLDIVVSADGGSTWGAVTSLGGVVSPQHLVAYQDNRTVIISRGTTNVVYTIDKGTTWKVHSTAISVGQLATSEENFLSLETAKYVQTFGNALLLGNVKENGITKGTRLRISDVGKLYGYRNNYIDFPDAIVSIQTLRTKGIVYTTTGVHTIEQTGDFTAPFKVSYNVSKYTAFKNEGITQIFDHLVYQAVDYTIRAFNGERAYDLSTGNKTLLNANKLKAATWCPRVGTCFFTKDTAGAGLIALKVGKMLNPAVEIGESYQIYTETYPDTITHIAEGAYSNTALSTKAGKVILQNMWIKDKATDEGFSAASTPTLTMTSGILLLGSGQKGFLESLNVFGKSSVASGTVSITATVYPSTTTYAKTFTLNESGFSMPIGSDCIGFKLALTNTGTGLKNITKVVAQLKNMRAY